MTMNKQKFWLLGCLLALPAFSWAQSGPPVLSFMFPNSGGQGGTVQVTLTGSNFTSPANISVLTPGSPPVNPGVAVSGITVVSATQINATFAISANATLGPANVTVITSFGTTGAVSFTITTPTPTLTSIAPASGAQGASISVTLTGANFTSPASVSVSNESISAAVTSVTPTQITATFAIAPGAPLGPTSVSVSTSVGFSGNLTFTVVPPVPTLTLLNPGGGLVGTAVAVTIFGTNFQAGATVNVSNPDVTVSGTTVVSAAQITATFSISPTAAFGSANVTVTTAGGTSAPLSFGVVPPAPTLTSINPASGAQSAAVTVTLTGTNFVDGPSVNVSNSGIAVSNVNVVSATQMTATLTIASTAALGPASVTVATPGGISAAVTFTVTPPGPVISSISPASGTLGASVPVTLTGANFLAGATVAVSNSGVTVSNVTVVSATQITANFAIAVTASPGPANVTVTASNGTSAPAVFTINPAGPTLTSISPTSGSQGTTVPVTLTGTNFIAGAAVNVSNTGITISNLTVVGPTQITATFVIAASAPLSTASVTVTTSTGTSGPVSFGVTQPQPSITSITPASGLQGTSVPVTLTGVNFLSGATITVSNSGVTVSNVNVVSATQITATFAISAGAVSGAANVTVSTSAGTSAPAVFTVGALVPTLTSIAPATGSQGTSVPVTLTGTNFASGATVSVSNNSISVSNVAFVSTTQITATFAIALNAAAGPANVTVSTSAGASGPVTFTVSAAVLPTVSITGGEGSTVNPLGAKTFSVGLPSPATAPSTGTLGLQFTSDAVNPDDSDAEIGFVNGSATVRSVAFSFSPGQTQAVLSPAGATVQTGTVSGTVSVLISSYLGGTPSNPIIGTIKVARTAPQITNIKLANKTASGFDVCVAGYSSTRDIAAVTYQFNGSGQGALQTTQLTAGSDLTGKFTSWFQGAASAPTGGQFLLDQTFNVTGSDTTIGSITVTLQNVTGTTTSVSVPYSGFAASCN